MRTLTLLLAVLLILNACPVVPALADAPQTTDAASRVSLERTDEVNGTLLAVFGLIVGGFSAIKKFGGPELKVTPHGTEYSDETYTTANFVLMAVGAGCVAAGVAIEVGNREDRADRETRLSLALASTPLSAKPGLALQCWF